MPFRRSAGAMETGRARGRRRVTRKRHVCRDGGRFVPYNGERKIVRYTKRHSQRQRSRSMRLLPSSLLPVEGPPGRSRTINQLLAVRRRREARSPRIQRDSAQCFLSSGATTRWPPVNRARKPPILYVSWPRCVAADDSAIRPNI